MTRPLIIRGLWGDITQRKRNRGFHRDGPCPRAELLSHVRDAAVNYEPVDVAIACGSGNRRYLENWLGFDRVVEFHDEPWASPRLSDEQYPERSIWSQVWGMSTWWHKLAMIRWALERFAAVLWLDWRVRCVAPARLDEWLDSLVDREGFGGNLIIQRTQTWGATWRQDDGARHELIGGGLLYFAGELGRRIVNLAIANMEDHPRHNDQIAMAAAVDMHHGTWIGKRNWRRLYELPGYYYGANRWYTPEAETVWQCGERMSKLVHRHRLWRLRK